ncbi:MAG: hypothetical protein CYPHOPRED_000201 [Cyphobasidiales sp. Tagirdzhanova-0007]|nr:MAG: hypothetical protein CYPHOPRED_000201 [Cyphobasidiales sp. Tagirdzhanova-0007]
MAGGRPSLSARRLAKELSGLKEAGCPAGCALVKAEDLETWFISIELLGESVFQGERYLLRFRFDGGYPMEAPEVIFMVTDGWKAPEHPHVYSNGHICMSLLAATAAVAGIDAVEDIAETSSSGVVEDVSDKDLAWDE